MGGAGSYRVRSQIRALWPSLLVVAVLVGGVFGGSMAAAAAARRTASAYSRYVSVNDGWDALQVNYAADGSAVLDATDVDELPGVVSVEQAPFEYAALGPGTAYFVSPSGRDVAAIPQRLIAGQPLDPEATNEAVIAYALAERENLTVGDSFELFDPEIIDELDDPEDRAFVEDLLARVPEARINIVGIAVAPGWFPPLVSFGQPLMEFSAGFADADASAGENSVLFIRLAEGADVTRFEEAVNAVADDEGGASLLLHRDIARDVARSLRPQVVALSALAGVLLVAGLVITSQAISRHVDADAADRRVLAAVGLTSRDHARTAAILWLSVGAVAAAVGMVVAVAFSPLSPTGLARLAEPDRGLSVDVTVLALGSLVCITACVGAVVVLTRRRLHVRTATTGGRRSRFGAGTVAGAGVRIAFDRGEPSNRVPVWSVVAGVSVAVAATVAAFTVGATLDRQLDDPQRYGVRWDIELTNYETSAPAHDGADLLADDPRVSAVAKGHLTSDDVGDREVTIMGLDPVVGELRPPLVEGTYPDTLDAVALGSRTLERLGAAVGDTVEIGLETEPSTFRVVGEVVMPPQGAGGRLDEGALFSVAGLERAAGDEVVLELFASLSSGADDDDVIADIEAEVGDVVSIPPRTPDDIVDLGRARSMPTMFAAATAASAIAAFAHTMVVGTRRRRRDLAVLKALGFTSRQLRTTILVQAAVLAAVALALGLVGGVGLGRVAWTALAETIGSPLDARTPLGLVGVLLPAVSVVAVGAVSWWPGRDAARSRPATTLLMNDRR